MWRLGVPPVVTQHDAFIINGFSARDTAVGKLIGEMIDSRHKLRSRFLLCDRSEGLNISKVIQKAMQSIGCPLLPFKLQGSLKTNPDEEFEIMCKAGDQRQEFLGSTEFLYPSLLRLR